MKPDLVRKSLSTLPTRVSLTTDSSRRFRIRRNKLRARRQVTRDRTSELELSDAQLNNFKAHVDRRFLTGYDCAEPREVKPISSFIQDPCEPTEASDKDTYEIIFTFCW